VEASFTTLDGEDLGREDLGREETTGAVRW